MPDAIFSHTSRVLLAAAAFAGLALWEVGWPRRAHPQRLRRWPANLGLGALNAGLVRLIAPAAGVSAAAWGTAHAWGVLPHLALPAWLAWSVAVVLLDLAVWVQHWALHRARWLWPLHRLHHADDEIDVSTALRFNPAEIAGSTAYRAGALLLLGASPGAALTFELLLTLGSLFSHANVRVPADRWLRAWVVTPDMHRVHHSTRREEQDSNFGFCLACWDRLFGTYRERPAAALPSMPLGLGARRQPQTPD